MSTNKKSSKVSKVLSIAALAFFVSFVGFTIFSISNITSVVESKIASSEDSMPLGWSEIKSSDDVESVISYKVIERTKLQYLVKVQNNSANSAIITHLASYMEDGREHGFVPMNNGLLEYSYDQLNKNSWVGLKVSEPGNEASNFRLDRAIYLGKSGDSTDTVYFRYMVDLTEEGDVNDKISVIVEDNTTGEKKVANNTIGFAYKKSSDTQRAAELIAQEELNNDESGIYTRPLGVNSDSISNSSISAGMLGTISLSPEAFDGNMMIVIASIAVFAVVITTYLVVVKIKR